MNTYWNTFITWFNPQGLLQVTPPKEWRFMYVYIGIIAFCAVAGIIVAFLRIHPELKSRIASFLWTNAIFGLVLFFFRYERIPYLGMDILRTIHEISIILWIGYLIWYSMTGFKQELLADKVTAHKAKYLPKQK